MIQTILVIYFPVCGSSSSCCKSHCFFLEQKSAGLGLRPLSWSLPQSCGAPCVSWRMRQRPTAYQEEKEAFFACRVFRSCQAAPEVHPPTQSPTRADSIPSPSDFHMLLAMDVRSDVVKHSCSAFSVPVSRNSAQP